MDDEPVERLLGMIRAAGAGMPHEREAAQAEVQVIIAKELAGGMTQLSERVSEARTLLGTRLQELTTALSDSAKSSSEQAAALVRWTRWYVAAPLAILGVTAIGVVMGALRECC